MADRKVAIQLAALAGIAMLGYLLFARYAGEGPSLCRIGEGLDCDVASKSRYAEFFGIPAPIIGGIPVSVIGIGYFAAVIFLSRFGNRFYPHVLVLSALAVPPALYLSYVQYFVLGSVCLLCELSKVAIGIITYVSLDESMKNRLLKIEL